MNSNVRINIEQHQESLKKAALLQGEVEAQHLKYCIDKSNREKARQLFKQFLLH